MTSLTAPTSRASFPDQDIVLMTVPFGCSEDPWRARAQRSPGYNFLSFPGTRGVSSGDLITLEGSAGAFADASSLFAGTSREAPNAFTRRPPPDAAWIDLEKTVELKPDTGAVCGHLSAIRPVRPSARGCEECLRTGDRWVHLRICMSCGHVGCCDSSPNRHATKHHESTSHPIIRSIDLGENWGWCYPDQAML